MLKIKLKIFCFLLAIFFGIFMFIFGGYDDSPGAQLIGAIAVIIGVVGLIVSKRRTTPAK